MVQWLGLGTFTRPTAKGPGSTPGGGTKIPQATQCSQKKKKKERKENGPKNGDNSPKNIDI